MQGASDDRGVPLRHVGVKELRYPLTVWDRNHRRQSTVGTFTLTVDLPHHYKGTHMSRFLSVLERHSGEVSLETLPALVDELRNRLDADRAHVRVDFPYFVRRAAPVSGETAWLELRCWFIGDAAEREARFTLGVETPVMAVCPCSKAISQRGAHCQRSRVRVALRFRELVWIEEIAEWCEASASSPLFPLLKRDDEKWVTERSYDNPVFVEDLVRNVALRLRGDERIVWFQVEAENEESIHAHNAFAATGSEEFSAPSPASQRRMRPR